MPSTNTGQSAASKIAGAEQIIIDHADYACDAPAACTLEAAHGSIIDAPACALEAAHGSSIDASALRRLEALV